MRRVSEILAFILLPVGFGCGYLCRYIHEKVKRRRVISKLGGYLKSTSKVMRKVL